MMTLVWFLVAIALLVFVHEMGHYLAARQVGVSVERFSIGFGKPLLKWVSQKSGTEWVVAAIPLGGYVKMDDAGFEQKSLSARSWVVFAGPLANFIFAALAYAVLFSAGRDEPVAVLGPPVTQSPAAQAGVMAGDRVISIQGHEIRSFSDIRWRMAQSVIGSGDEKVVFRLERNSQPLEIQIPLASLASKDGKTDPSAVIGKLGLMPLSDSVVITRVQPGSAAEKSGLVAGDRILKLQGADVTQPETVIAQVQASGGKPLVLLVTDGVTTEQVTVAPTAGADGVFRMGAVVGPRIATEHVSDSLPVAAWRGVVRTWEMSILTFQALGKMLMGEMSWKQISGPVSIADAAGQSAGMGFQAFMGFLALISISLAVLNLLPIPMLDGGHLLYYLWEFVRGEPLPAEVQDAGRRIGIALIAMLTVLALFNDFSRLAGW